MSKLHELIEELCPDGVEYKEIKDIATVSIGEFVHKNKQLPNGPYPVYNGGITNTGFYDKYNRTANKIIISARGNAGYVNRVFVDFWSGNSCYTLSVDDENVDWNYVYYALKNSENRLRGMQQKAGIPAISKKQIEEFVIPVPPLPVQQEIVRILDNFTELKTQLTTELKAEIEARKKQYEYYRDWLLSQEELNKLCPDGVQYKSIGEVCDFRNGFAFKSSKFKDNGEPILRISNIQDEKINTNNLAYFDLRDYAEDLSPYIVNKGDIVVAMSGATTGKIGINDTDNIYYLNQRVGKFIPNEEIILNKLLYHILTSKTDLIYQLSGGGAQPNLSSEKLKKIKIPVPPLPVQQKIVRILDNFTELTVELETELEARQKQYEYYRDKLLSFKEATA